METQFETKAKALRCAERLGQVVRVLEELPSIRSFDMGNWMYGKPAECGTVGCAVGWAASDPWFQERGLTLVKNRAGFPMFPRFGVEEGYGACRHFFGILSGDVERLFSPDGYSDLRPQRHTVIRRIKSFIKAAEKQAAAF